MTAAAMLLIRLRDLGVTVRVDAGDLRLRPASAVPLDLLAGVRSHKADFLALLAGNESTPRPALAPAAPAQPADPTLAALQAACDNRAVILAGSYHTADVLADREAVEAEGLLLAPGTAERDRLDRQHATMVAGLLRVSWGKR